VCLSQRFELVYRATRDGFSAAAFHGKCDNKGATVCVITSWEGCVFGGYAAVPWNSRITYTPDDSAQSFLFSLKNMRNAPPTRFSLVNKEYAIYGDSSYGPYFGFLGEIKCCDGSERGNNSWTNLGGRGTYSNPTGLPGTAVFTGQRYFAAEEIEVYMVL
jgi:hypothetical protein